MKPSFYALVILAIATSAYAVDPINKSVLTKVAIHGYDAVAYFADAKPVEGSIDFTHEWKGAKWRFATAAHRDLFAKDPEKYAPQYGGYCAFGVSRGYAVGIDPEAWAVINGKLYLNYDKKVQKAWLENPAGYITKADANWPRLLAE